MIIRPENPAGISAIRHVNELAFGRSQETDLMDVLRQVAHPFASFVAVEGDQVVGHIAFSPVTIESGRPVQFATELVPMAVLPEYQR